jgi:hypothetical protein
MFFLGRQDKQMRLDIARAGGSAGPRSAGPQRPRITALSEPHMHHTRRGARGARGPSGPSGLSGASGPSGPLERFDIASELDGVPQRVDRATVLSHHPRVVPRAQWKARRNRPIFRGAGHGGPRAQVQGPVRPHNGRYVLPAPRGAFHKKGFRLPWG